MNDLGTPEARRRADAGNMMTQAQAGARCAVLVGSTGSGKTTLLEALLYMAGAVDRKGSVASGTTVGDGAAEARSRQMSVEPNFARTEYLGESWTLIDCPGSVELCQDGRAALMAADVAVVVTEPTIEQALTLAPLFHFLAEHDIPHLVFINKMDKAGARIREVMEALQTVSPKPLVLRQVPIRDGDSVTGFVDLVSERSYRYARNRASELIEMPAAVREREDSARWELLEGLADFDDRLLEQLLDDSVPPSEEVYAQLTKAFQEDLVAQVLLGSAEGGNGLTRLWKALRHEAPAPQRTAARLGIPAGEAFAATVVKTVHQEHIGKLSIARIWHGRIGEGVAIGDLRPAGLYSLMGQSSQKVSGAAAGEVVALQRLEGVRTGDLLTPAGIAKAAGIPWPEVPPPVFALALAPRNRQDDVKLTASLARLCEEDPSLSVEHNSDTRQLLLWGQGEIQLQLAVERLKSKFNVAVDTAAPLTAFRETIRQSTTQHSRFKRQSGGHGQFADVKVEISPLPRGGGFEFSQSIVGGAVPKNYIPAVEQGVKEFLHCGPLGFPVVDVAVKLVDGQYHSVDSSEQAFKTAGRLAMSEALPNCEPVLLEPICEVVVSAPSDFTARIHGMVSGRRGQILGSEPKPGWDNWDELRCWMPEAELHDLAIELRSLTRGVGSFEWRFDHLQELSGRLAEEVVRTRGFEAAAARGA